MTARTYDVHGVRLLLDYDDDAVAGAVDDRLRHFRAAGVGGEPDVRFELRTVRGGGEHAVTRPEGEARAVYEPPAGEVSYFPGPDVLWIDVEDSVRVSVTRERVRASAREGALEDRWLLSRPLFTIPLLEVLKRHGLYGVHAAALARDGGAVLLPGTSGSGKSTLAVALVLAGWDFMSDDMAFLSRGEDRLRVLAFPDEVDVSDETAGMFAELSALAGARLGGWPKHRVRADEAFGAATAAAARPAALAFPSRSATGVSTLEPMPAAAALLELAPNVLLTEPASSQRHLDALGELVRTAPAYRLAAGRDFERVPDLLRRLLRG